MLIQSLSSAVIPHHAMQVALKLGMWIAETWNTGTENPEDGTLEQKTRNTGAENLERLNAGTENLERWNRKHRTHFLTLLL